MSNEQQITSLPITCTTVTGVLVYSSSTATTASNYSHQRDHRFYALEAQRSKLQSAHPSIPIEVPIQSSKGLNISRLNVCSEVGSILMQLISPVVCQHVAPSVQWLATDGRMMCCHTTDSCQSDATSEIVKLCWSCAKQNFNDYNPLLLLQTQVA